jgi:hypothetical protein
MAGEHLPAFVRVQSKAEHAIIPSNDFGLESVRRDYTTLLYHFAELCRGTNFGSVSSKLAGAVNAIYRPMNGSTVLALKFMI